MSEFFRFLVEANLVTAVFVIGAIAFILAVIGNIKTIIEPSPAMRFLLAVFGIVLMVLSFGSYFISYQTKTNADNAPAQITTAPTNVTQSTVSPSLITTQPSSTPISQPEQQTVYNCLIYKSGGKGVTWEIDINVASGEIAFIDAWGFDDRSGGVFVTITGPYTQHHTIHDSAFCGGIPANSNYEPVKEQRLSQLNEPFQRISLP